MNLESNKIDTIPSQIANNKVIASEYNQIAGSLMAVQNAAGLTPDASDNTQLLTAIQTLILNEVNKMLGRIDYSNATSFVIYSNNGSYTIPSDGYIQLVGSNNTNTFTDYDANNYLKFLRCVTVNNKTVLNIILPQLTTGSSSNNTVCINSAVNTLISVSQGDIIKAIPVPASSGLITYGYYSFYFLPQK